MKFQLLINKKSQAFSTLVIPITFGLISCRSSDNVINGSNNEQAVVKINMLGSESESEQPVKSASITKAETSVDATIQRQTISLNQKYSILATLTPEYTSINNTIASVNPMAGVIKREKLSPGNEYVVVVYDDKGNYLEEKTFIYGQQQSGFQLTGGKSYTFVAYSVNYTSMANRIPQDAPLSQAKLEGIAGDLMFFKKTMTVTGDKENYLDVILKHRYSQITTSIDASAAGNVTDISGSAITPVSPSATLNFATPDKLTYEQISTTGAQVDFPTKNQPIITSTPTLLISEGTSPGELNIKSLTVGGTTRNNIKINNLKITPGVKYNLNLKIDTALQTIKVLSLIPDAWTSNLSTDIYTSAARSKLNNKSNFGPNGKVRVSGFDFQTVDVRNKSGSTGSTDAEFEAAIDAADIIWISYIVNSNISSSKRAILEQKIADKKKFFFTGNDNNGYFPGTTPFAGHTFAYLGAGPDDVTVIEGAGPTKGIFGNLPNGAVIKQLRAVGKVTSRPSNSIPFLKNVDGSDNAVATDNFVVVSDINWYINRNAGDGFYAEQTDLCTDNNSAILFCNIFEKAVNYIKNTKGQP